MNPSCIFTIGHSTHPLEAFVALLRQHGITALADVRSSPFSRFNPQFNQAVLERALQARAIQYVFLGDGLGGRPRNPSGYNEAGRARYGHLAETSSFQQGIDRLIQGSKKYQIALMCAEKDPQNCHRTILIAPVLTGHGIEIGHILADGSLEPHAVTMQKLRRQTSQTQDELCHPKDQLALAAQEKRIAHKQTPA